jgi:hypothetical protein
MAKVQISRKFLMSTLGEQGALRFMDLAQRANKRQISPEEMQELQDMQTTIEGREPIRESGDLGVGANTGGLSELRFIMNSFDDPEKALKAGNAVLQRMGVEGTLHQVPNQPGQFAILTNDGRFVSVNPEGFDASDIAAGAGTATDALPLITGVGGAIAGGVPSGGAGAGAGFGAGAVAGGLAKQGIQEFFEARNVGEQNLLERAGDIGLEGLKEVGFNAGGRVIGSVVNPAISRVAARAAKNGVGSAADDVVGNLIPDSVKGRVAEAGGRALEGARQSPFFRNFAVEGFNDAVGGLAKTTAGSLALGVDRVMERTIISGLERGLGRDEILSLVKEEMSLLKFQLEEGRGALNQARETFATDSGAFLDSVQLTAEEANLAANQIDQSINQQIGKIDEFVNETFDAKFLAAQSDDASLNEVISNRVNQLNDELITLDQAKAEASEALNLETLGGRLDSIESRAGSEALGAFDPNRANLIGQEIQDRAILALKEAEDFERAAFAEAKELAAAEAPIQIEGFNERFNTEVIDQIKGATNFEIDIPVKEFLLSELGTNPTPAQMFELGNKLGSLVRTSDNPATRAIAADLRGRLISDEDSIFQGIRAASPAVSQFLDTSAARVARHDALQTQFLNPIVGKGANLRTGDVARDTATSGDAFDRFIKLNQKGARGLENFNEFIGLDDNIVNEAITLEAQRTLAKTGDPIKTLSTLKQNPLFSSEAGQGILKNLEAEQTSILAGQAEREANKTGFRNTKLDIDSQKRGIRNEQKELTGKIQELEALQAQQDAGVDPIIKGVNADTNAGLNQAQSTLANNNVTDQAKRSLFRNNFILDGLSKAKQGEEFRTVAKNLQGATFTDQPVPTRFTPFGEGAADDIVKVNELAGQEQRVSDLADINTKVQNTISSRENQPVTRLIEGTLSIPKTLAARPLNPVSKAVGQVASRQGDPITFTDQTSAQGQGLINPEVQRNALQMLLRNLGGR